MNPGIGTWGKCCALCFALSTTACATASPSERALWVEDFEQLVDHMAGVYANLEWAVDERDIDVYALSEEARASIDAAGSRRAARKSIEKFVGAFQDPHFFVKKGDQRAQHSNSPLRAGIAPGTNTKDALKAMNFRGRDLDFRIDFEDLPGFESVVPSAENPFSWATFEVGGRPVGLLRIAHFGEDGYPKIAEALWPAFAAELDEDCDIYCQWSFRETVMNQLLGFLAEGARTLVARDIEAMVIDISGNGGGTDWAAVAPRIFAPPLTKCPPIGVVRHPHHASRLDSRREDLEGLLAELNLTPESRRMLTSARDSVAARAGRAHVACDRAPLFHEESATLSCTQLVFSPGCGVFEYLPEGSLGDVEARSTVFRPLGNSFEESIWNGPLFVVIDGGTASASEHFVALLEANDAATFVGQRTYGAGCGFIGGGVPAYLPNLDLTVRMPDCARYRANGRNEMDGIEPDVEIDWDGGDGARASRIHAALAKELAP